MDPAPARATPPLRRGWSAHRLMRRRPEKGRTKRPQPSHPDEQDPFPSPANDWLPVTSIAPIIVFALWGGRRWLLFLLVFFPAGTTLRELIAIAHPPANPSVCVFVPAVSYAQGMLARGDTAAVVRQTAACQALATYNTYVLRTQNALTTTSAATKPSQTAQPQEKKMTVAGKLRAKTAASALVRRLLVGPRRQPLRCWCHAVRSAFSSAPGLPGPSKSTDADRCAGQASIGTHKCVSCSRGQLPCSSLRFRRCTHPARIAGSPFSPMSVSAERDTTSHESRPSRLPLWPVCACGDMLISVFLRMFF
ncbi:hypothetical protein B0J12DRAFT_44135 [Macrophomina phaseolina]|uniref:Uncharacterized protein n=1 Tax=Macrophomina phaseolina TaxID=35725 RepID=A0ABQ8GDM9_9PEZI|nr:hypothetical protein B0J12DRAFT_44135 [Macrophomina phaseolina]